jgi:deoxyribodipyrimidine photo-lyase
MANSLWWIRRDLRLTDNGALAAALAYAASQGGSVIPVFVIDPTLAASPYWSERRWAFLLGGLRALEADLRQRDSHLIVRRGQPEAVLAELLAEAKADMIVAEADVSLYARRRDTLVARTLPLRLIDGLTAQPPGAVLKADGSPYTVFTPFSRAWKARPLPAEDDLTAAPDRILTPDDLTGEALPDLAQPGDVGFAPGEAEAQRRLRAFVSGPDAPVYAYGDARNRMDFDGTSSLSPYCGWG